MGQFAILVDAGYLLAWGAHRRVGARAPRTAVQLDHRRLLRALVGHCRSRSGLELLRVHWYDGAAGRVPTADHREIGREDGVKVRLGRLTSRGRRGVDAMIVLDLVTLARARAASTAFLLSGDDDLREAVLFVQQLGLRVGVLGLAPATRADALAREADLRSDVTGLAEACFSHAGTDAYGAGWTFGQLWVSSAPAEAARQVRAMRARGDRRLSSSLATQLDARVRAVAGASPAPLEPWRLREARRGFWDAIR